MPGSILLHIYFKMYRIRFKMIRIPFLPSVYLSRNFYNLPVELIREIIASICDNSHLYLFEAYSCIKREAEDRTSTS